MFNSSADLILKAARDLWNYHRLGENVRPADGILVFGSNDLRVADYAAVLYQQGIAPWILFTGARGRMTEHWPDTEAACFATRVRELGVPDECIHCEPNATHTGENIAFSKKLLLQAGLKRSHVIVLQKPYMERRTRASLETQWPELSFQVSSPPLEFEQYPTGSITMDDLIHAMVGDFFRIMDYANKGISSPQEILPTVLDAYHFLIDAGYTRQMPG